MNSIPQQLRIHSGQHFGAIKRPGWLCSSSNPRPPIPLFLESSPSLSFQERLSDEFPTTYLSSSDSLSDLLSSPERYAFSLNMTQKEVEYQKEFYQNASGDLQKRLERLDEEADLSPATVGKRKHEMICEHRLKYGRHPFVCSKCWAYLPVCVCRLAAAPSRGEGEGSKVRWNYPNLKVLVWTHHREWGLTSNTGSILGLTLGNHISCSDNTYIDTVNYQNNPCRLLMKGLPAHDDTLQKILDVSDDDSTMVVVLWPSSNPENKISLAQLRRELEASDSKDGNPQVSDASTSSSQRMVILLAVDGTWRNARRMVAKLPSHVKQLDLDESAIRWNDNAVADDKSGSSKNISSENSLSILAPLRRRGPSGKQDQAVKEKADGSTLQNEKRQVCTAEAVIAALHGLGAIDIEVAQHILYTTQTKVDRVRRYRGKVHFV